MTITVIDSEEEIAATYSVMKQLRPHLEEATYVSAIQRLQAETGYRLVALYEEGVVRAAAGYRIVHTLASGRFLYVDDLITDEASRSRGYAKRLFDWLEREAADRECVALHLDSGVQRFEAHRFYLKQKMKISCHHFEKSISI
jgi:Acetyltransferase (GNAT) family.